MAVNAYLVFDGNCGEALEYYTGVFETEKPRVMTFGEAPSDPAQPLPESAGDKVMHALMTIDGSSLMFSDTFPGTPFTVGNNITLVMTCGSAEYIRRVYDRLAKDGKVGMELQETFWSKCYGSVTDRFGVTWQLSLDDGSAHQ